MILQPSKPFSPKWRHSLLLYFSEVVLLWIWRRQCSWAQPLILGKHSDRIVGLQEGINPVWLLFAFYLGKQLLNLNLYMSCRQVFGSLKIGSQSGKYTGVQGCCWGISLLLAPPAPTRAVAYLEVVFTNKEEPVGYVLISVSLGCTEHEIVE